MGLLLQLLLKNEYFLLLLIIVIIDSILRQMEPCHFSSLDRYLSKVKFVILVCVFFILSWLLASISVVNKKNAIGYQNKKNAIGYQDYIKFQSESSEKVGSRFCNYRFQNVEACRHPSRSGIAFSTELSGNA